MTDLAFCVAVALIVAGVAFIYWPAALIVAGVAGVIVVWLAAGVDEGQA